MPKIKTSALVSDIKGKAEGSVFARNSGGLYFRNNPSGGGRKSQSWDKSKNLFGSLASRWRNLTQAQQEAWNNAVSSYQTIGAFGDARIPSGYELYMRLNTPLVNIGLPALETPESPEQMPTVDSINFYTSNNNLLLPQLAANSVLNNIKPSEALMEYGVFQGMTYYSVFYASQFALNSSDYPSEVSEGETTTLPYQITSFTGLLNINNPSFQLDVENQSINFDKDLLPLITYGSATDDYIEFSLKRDGDLWYLQAKTILAGVDEQSFQTPLLIDNDIITNVTVILDQNSDFGNTKVFINGVFHDLELNVTDTIEPFTFVKFGSTADNYIINAQNSSILAKSTFDLSVEDLLICRSYIPSSADFLYIYTVQQFRKNLITNLGNFDMKFLQSYEIPKPLLILFSKANFAFNPLINLKFDTQNVSDDFVLVLESTGYISSGKIGATNAFKRIAVLPFESQQSDVGIGMQSVFGLVANNSSARFRFRILNTKTGQYSSYQQVDDISVIDVIQPANFCEDDEGCDQTTFCFNISSTLGVCLWLEEVYEGVDDPQRKRPKFKAGAELSGTVN